MEKEFEKYGVSPPILVYLQWLYTLKTKNVYFVCLFVKKKKKKKKSTFTNTVLCFFFSSMSAFLLTICC